MATKGKNKYSALLPSFMSGMGYKTEEEFLYLGKSFMVLLIQLWRNQENLNRRMIKQIVKTSPDVQLVRALSAENKRLGGKIKLLQELKRRAEEKPALPSYRPSNWFRPEEIVAVYDGNNFLCGEVVSGPRHLEGMFSVWMDNYGADNKIYGLADGTILHSWELNYLCKPENREYAALWVLDGMDTHPGYDFGLFMQALEREHEAQATTR